MPEKSCFRCEIIKPFDDFYNSSFTIDGKNIYCKKCQNAMVIKNEMKYKVNGPEIFPDKKVCSSCKEMKPISQFCKNRRRKDGYHHYCKPCWRNYVERAKRRQGMYNG